MSISIETLFCSNCQSEGLVIKEKPNHLSHFILFIFTGGLWALVWIMLTIGFSFKKFKCCRCGKEIG